MLILENHKQIKISYHKIKLPVNPIFSELRQITRSADKKRSLMKRLRFLKDLTPRLRKR